MFDQTLRPLKDHLFNPLCPSIPSSITPTQITLLAFLTGLLSCLTTSLSLSPSLSISFWLLNRAFDCLDGALARHRNVASDLGGFWDLLGDFTIYSLIPIACGVRDGDVGLAVGVVEMGFHLNNFVLFYAAAVQGGKGKKELTSVTMRPAVIEGMESGVLFTVMLAVPGSTDVVCWFMSGLVGVAIWQRVSWIRSVLKG